MTLETEREVLLRKIAKRLSNTLIKHSCDIMEMNCCEHYLTKSEQDAITATAMVVLVATMGAAARSSDPEDWLDTFKSALDEKEPRELMAEIRANFLRAYNDAKTKGV